jgi:hypothetical protein
MSTPQGGGSRRPSATKAVAGGKPNLSKDGDEKPPAKAASKAASARKAGAPVRKAGADRKPAPAKKAAASKSATSRSAAAKSAPAKKAPAKKAAAGARFGGGGGGRKTLAPVRVSQGRNWGPIALTTAVILIAVGIIGFAGWKVYETGLTVEDRVGRIDGTVNWRKKDPKLTKAAQHEWGPLTYAQNPPVGGKHNYNWQNCMGDVYDAPIANEHAVHSMEHGAVWVTYNASKLSKDQVEALAAKVRGKEYLLMSPYEGLDKAVSIQAWGFQLKTDNPADKRIDEFIKVARKNAGVESAQCSGGITETGTTPRNLQQPQQPGQ